MKPALRRYISMGVDYESATRLSETTQQTVLKCLEASQRA